MKMNKMRNKTQASASAENRPKRVGVFVDEMPQSIVTRVYNYELDFVQLHGNESAVMSWPVSLSREKWNAVPLMTL